MYTVALLGAESTGKTRLATVLAERFEQAGKQVLVLAEPLRQWCDEHGRSPLPHEQWQLAHRHTQTLRRLRSQVEVLIAETSPLQTAAYSAYYFQDESLNAYACKIHAELFDTTLLMGTDLPWQPDPGQRSGAHTQAPVDAHLRRLLSAMPGHSYALVYGQGSTRTANAWRHLSHVGALGNKTDRVSHSQATLHQGCTGCGDPGCERQLFDRLKAQEYASLAAPFPAH